MNDIKDFLASIGFGKNETEIYSALVELGTSSVLQISKHTKIHRSNIYDALRVLVERGLVYEINQATKLFSARPPESLVHYLQQRTIELNEIVKHHQKKVKKDVKAKAKLAQGHFALREAFLSLLETGKRIDVYGIPKNTHEEIGPIVKDFHKDRIKKKVLMRHIYNSDAIDRANYISGLNYTEAKIVPKKYNSLATTFLSGDKVIIVLWESPVNIIEITDEYLANSYSNYFEMLWSKAKKV